MSAAPATAPATRSHAFHPLRVVRVEPLTDEAVLLEVEVPPHLRDAYAFTPGQHVTLRAVLDGQEVRRSYSICTSPHSGRLAVAVKRLEGGVFSGWVHQHLRPGELLDVGVPAGRFGVVPDATRARSVVAVVAGSGITPVMSVFTALLEDEPGSRCTLVYGNRTAASVMFLEELADLKDRYPDRLQLVHVLSRERPEVDLLAGRVDRAKLQVLLDHVVPPDDVDEWLLCGPFAMVEEVRGALVERGVAPSAVHLELFHVDGEAPRVSRRPADGGAASAAEVTVRLDGRTTTFAMPEEGSVLEALLAVRADAPYACKGGVCGTCRAKLVEGQVEMGRNYALEQAELEAGFVLACQSVPTTPTAVLDFDA